MRRHRIATSPAPAIPKLPPESHLTESQIDDYIIGDLAPAPAAHLAICPLCADRVSVAASPFTSFQALGTTWSERLSAALPAPTPAPQKPLWQRHIVLAAPCCVLVLGLTVLHSTYVNNAASRAAQTSTAADTAADTSRQSRVSADDQMLDAIEADVNSDADSPADLGLRPVSATPPSSTPTSVRD